MSGRILLILIVVAIAILVVRRLIKSSSRPVTRKDTGTARMVQCAQCGLYLPEREAISHEGRYYCSLAHRQDHKP
jgi:uncharacterized protein